MNDSNDAKHPLTIRQAPEPEFNRKRLSSHVADRGHMIADYRRRQLTLSANRHELGYRNFWQSAEERGFTPLFHGYAARLETLSHDGSQPWAQQWERHIHQVLYLSQWDSRTVVADQSAALVWGLPILGNVPKRVQRVSAHGVVVGQSRNQQTRRNVVPPDGVVIGQVSVTSIEQTIVDLACEVGGEDALVALDFALHHQLTSKERVEECMARFRGRQNIRRMQDVLAVADGRVESPGESRTRWRFYTSGLVVPQAQVWVGNGEWRYRLDNYDPVSKVGFEFDGQGKYDFHERGAGAAFHQERQRDADLQSAGITVQHLYWDDVSCDEGFKNWQSRFNVQLRIKRRRRRAS
ncbi:hypothetical protein INS90_07525 [Trueperella pecoris]|uniref:Transcriptional regulator, AbiEi antitoxin, Type IV TA system n=1 Tax=Trueperella pecoris TaxID=2733571 RepID=A0A7M1QYZ5_9ACTO|nr:hypothetical protein [Trueperella pecoris]QOR47113.1 hypothetical protein INS90_07525 [Trueperella pecoris]